MGPFADAVVDLLAALGQGLWAAMSAVLIAPGSVFSLASLATALAIGALLVTMSRKPGKRRLRPRVLLRAFFPRRIVRSASTKADFGLFLFNIFCAGGLFSGVIVSTALISTGVQVALEGILGARSTAVASPVLGAGILTTVAFLAYEFGYWLDHYLKHKVQFLWEFHKVHHTAQALTPLTAFRMHPVDSIIFGNILALVVGATNGAVAYAIGSDASGLTISGTNVILVAFLFLLIHLQHTHLWIAFTGVWGRLFISPAHHQLHHSDNPVHFGRNFGSCLAIWDWVFGTLHAPTKDRQSLTFGVSPAGPEQHSVTGCLVTPFLLAFRGLASARRMPSARPV